MKEIECILSMYPTVSLDNEEVLDTFFNFADDMVELLNPRFCTASINNNEILNINHIL